MVGSANTIRFMFIIFFVEECCAFFWILKLRDLAGGVYFWDWR